MIDRYDFASDNTAAICPEAWAACAEANSDNAVSYGEDKWTGRMVERVREIFETDCQVFLVSSGTAANALALSHLCRSYHTILCHELSHLEKDECGAPEFFSGGARLMPLAGRQGKLEAGDVEAAIRQHAGVHSSKPRVISISQSTELGTVYRNAEIGKMAEVARRHSLFLHMDGARLANAIASLDCSPRSITWDAGVDALSFGGTKNGIGMGDLVVFFRENLAHEFEYRIKQSGQLTSKMRFLAAQWTGLLTGDVWLENARRANAGARTLAERLTDILGQEPVFRCEANAVFLRLSEEFVSQLRDRGWHFYKFVEPDIYRLMCSWSVTQAAIDDFLLDVKKALLEVKTGN